jgi:hypothetical protein
MDDHHLNYITFRKKEKQSNNTTGELLLSQITWIFKYLYQ